MDGWDVRVGVPVLLVDGPCAGACATRMPVYAVSLIRESVCLLPSLLAYARCSSRVRDGIHAKASGARCVWVVGTQRRACVACGNSGSLPVVLVSTREEGQSHVAGRREAGDKEQNRMVRRWNCC